MEFSNGGTLCTQYNKQSVFGTCVCRPYRLGATGACKEIERSCPDVATCPSNPSQMHTRLRLENIL